jgi:hypothetical protein
MLTLGKTVAQYEQDQVKFLWEAPDGYNELKANRPWVLHGLKGSGKTTLLEYLQVDESDQFVSILQEGELFRHLVPAIQAGASARKNVETISELIEVLAYADVMRQLVASKLLAIGPKSEIYEFLVKNHLMQGSVIREVLRYLHVATDGFSKTVSSIANAPDAVEGPDFYAARAALKKLLAGLKQPMLVCIDEVDESGFAYSEEDRIIVNAMLAFCVRSNTALQNEKLPLRFLLSLPSELLSHARYWDSQKVRVFTHHLHWSDPKKLQNLLNKRIAIELNVHRRHPRHEGDRYSHEYEQTWKRVFPDSVQSKLLRPENAFSYVLRHTLYTPRNLLGCCQKILDILDGQGYTPEAAVARMTAADWSQVFQKGVEVFDLELVEDVLNVYGKIYTNLESCLLQFEGRPNIWGNGALTTFVRSVLADVLVAADTGDALSGDTLLDALYKVGFIGFGSRAPYTDHAPGASLNLSFAFLGNHERPRSWDFAVIAPAFYDYCHVKCSYGVPVVPHERLTLESRHLLEIGAYDPLGGLNQRRTAAVKSRVE